MRILYDERRAKLVESIRKQLGATLEVFGSEAGMHLLVGLPGGFNDVEIAKRAAAEKLWLAPLSPYYLGRVRRHGLILGFGGTSTSEIPDAVQQLRRILGLVD